VDKLLHCFADQIQSRTAQESGQIPGKDLIDAMWTSAKLHSGEKIFWISRRTRTHNPASLRFDPVSVEQDRNQLDKLARTLRAELNHGSLESAKALLGEHPKAMLDLIQRQSTVKTAAGWLNYIAAYAEKDVRGKFEFFLDMEPAAKRSAIVNRSDETGQTALHLACEEDNLEAIEALLQLGADASIRDEDEKTAFKLAGKAARGVLLRHAAAWGKPVQLNELKSGTPLLESADQDGNTPLCHALMHGNLRMAKALLALGANADHCNRHGASLLARACALGDPKWTRLLLGHCKQPDLQRSLCATMQSIAKGQAGLVVLDLLLQAGALESDLPTRGGSSMLEQACQLNLAPVARRLVEHGADASAEFTRGQSLQAWAQERGKTELQWQEFSDWLGQRAATKES
jgi:ankyrin repeat protein